MGGILDRKRDFAIEALRWIAIVAVVLHHGISRQRQSPETVDQILLFKNWIEWCVPAFFYISGQLFRPPTAGSFAGHILGRARRLLVPYALVSSLSFALMWALHNSGAWTHSQPQELQFEMFLHQMAWLAGFGPQLYFLPYLFVIGILAGLLCLLVPGRWLSLSAFAVFLACGFGWMMPTTVLGPSLQRVPVFLLAFCLGISDRSWGTRSHLHLAVALLSSIGVAVAIRSAWPISVAAPLVLYRILSHIPLEPAIRRLERLGNPGAIFLWHAPILLPAASMTLGRVGVLDWPNYLLSVAAACVGAILVDKLVARIPVLRHSRL